MNFIPLIVWVYSSGACIITWKLANQAHPYTQWYHTWSKWTHILSSVAFALIWIPPFSAFDLVIGLINGTYCYLFIWVIKWLMIKDVNANTLANLSSRLPAWLDPATALWIIIHHSSTGEIQELLRFSYLELADALLINGDQFSMAKHCRTMAASVEYHRHEQWNFGKKYRETRKSIDHLRFARKDVFPMLQNNHI